MHFFQYKDNELYCENVPLQKISRQVGTPFYVYSEATLIRHFNAFDIGFEGVEHLTCFAVKACSNVAILNLFGRMGGGADIVSGGELFRATTAGIPPYSIIYSGVGKTEDEIREALEANILMFNIESAQELDRVQRVALELDVIAPVGLRINPDVDPKTHSYISTGLAKNKFGIPVDEALEVYKLAKSMKGISIRGVSCHIGSQLTQIDPFVEALRKVKDFITRLEAEGIKIYYLDLGGGVGITYEDEDPPHPQDYAMAIKEELGDLDCTLILEPGRVIVGNAGILVTEVQYTKVNTGGQEDKRFVIVDAAMNDLTRPSLYGAYHEIIPVKKNGAEEQVVDIVGPICETGDFMARDRHLPMVEQGDLLAIMSSGAYGFTMSSNYNSRTRAAEVLVRGDKFYVIRTREDYQDLIKGETIPEVE